MNQARGVSSGGGGVPAPIAVTPPLGPEGDAPGRSAHALARAAVSPMVDVDAAAEVVEPDDENGPVASPSDVTGLRASLAPAWAKSPARGGERGGNRGGAAGVRLQGVQPPSLPGAGGGNVGGIGSGGGGPVLAGWRGLGTEDEVPGRATDGSLAGRGRGEEQSHGQGGIAQWGLRASVRGSSAWAKGALQ